MALKDAYYRRIDEQNNKVDSNHNWIDKNNTISPHERWSLHIARCNAEIKEHGKPDQIDSPFQSDRSTHQTILHYKGSKKRVCINTGREGTHKVDIS